MNSWVKVGERSARYRLPYQSLQNLPSQLCEDLDVAVDPESNTGQWDGRWLSTRYEWEIAPDNQGGVYEVTERVCLRKRDAALVTLLSRLIIWTSIGMLLFTFELVDNPNEIWLLLMLILGIFLIVLLLLVPVAVVKIYYFNESPEPLLTDRTRSLEYTPVNISQPLLLFTSFLLLLLLAVINTMMGILWIAFGMMTIMILHYIAAILLNRTDHILRLNRRITISAFSKVEKQANYMRYIFFIFPISLAVISAGIRLSDSVSMESSSIFTLADVPVSVMILVLAYMIISRIDDEWLAQARHNFLDNPGRQPNPRAAAVALGAILLLNVATTVSLLFLWAPDLVPIPGQPLNMPLVLLTITIMAMYVPAGSIYQSYSYLNHISSITEDATHYRPEFADIDFDFPIFCSEDIQSPIAIETRNTRAIVIPNSLRKKVDKKELAAIIAHEEAHLLRGDTRLARRLTFLSSTLMIGKNVLFQLVNFYQRELEADRHAAEQVGAEHLMSALTTLDKQEGIANNGLAAVGTSFISTGETDSIGSLIGRKFEIFHGGYALQQAHPSIRTRLENLQQESSS